MDDAGLQLSGGIIGSLISTAHIEALRCTPWRRREGEVRVRITDLLCAIVLEPDILRGLVNGNHAVNLAAIRQHRNPTRRDPGSGSADQRGRERLALLHATPPRFSRDEALQRVLDGTTEWLQEHSVDDFVEWESHGPNAAAVQEFRSQLLADPPPDLAEQARQQGTSEEELRRMLEAVGRGPASFLTGAERRRFAERNLRYAIIRQLVERSSVAAPDETADVLRTIGVSEADVLGTLDSLAMRYSESDIH